MLDQRMVLLLEIWGAHRNRAVRSREASWVVYNLMAESNNAYGSSVIMKLGVFFFFFFFGNLLGPETLVNSAYT